VLLISKYTGCAALVAQEGRDILQPTQRGEPLPVPVVIFTVLGVL
jgi:hypothetical protein